MLLQQIHVARQEHALNSRNLAMRSYLATCSCPGTCILAHVLSGHVYLSRAPFPSTCIYSHVYLYCHVYTVQPLATFSCPGTFLCAGSCRHAAGLCGEGERAAPRVPQGLPDGEQDTQEDEPQLLPHGQHTLTLLLFKEENFVNIICGIQRAKSWFEILYYAFLKKKSINLLDQKVLPIVNDPFIQIFQDIWLEKTAFSRKNSSSFKKKIKQRRLKSRFLLEIFLVYIFQSEQEP